MTDAAMVRFEHLELIGFGGVSGTLEVWLDADVTLVVGANGYGKTTICDGIAWALTGLHPRGADPRSLYSETGETQVRLRLSTDDGEPWTLVRAVSDPAQSRGGHLDTEITVSRGPALLSGSEAEVALFQTLLPQQAQGDLDGMRGALESAYYMQQDTLREFLTRRSDDERFMVLSRMVGAGALTDLVKEFESSRRAWTKALKQTEEATASIRARTDAAEATLRQIDASLSTAFEVNATDWRLWWRATGRALMEEDTQEPIFSDEQLRARLDALRHKAIKLEGRLDSLAALRAELFDLPRTDEDKRLIDQLTHERAKAEASLASMTQVIEDQEQSVRRAAERLQEGVDNARDLATLAQLALRFVSDECPTCGQHVDRIELAQRLVGIANQADQVSDVELRAAEANRNRSVAVVADLRMDYVRFDRELAEATARTAVADARRARFSDTLTSVGLSLEIVSDEGAALAAIDLEALRLTDSRAELLDLRDRAERLTLALATCGANERRQRIAAEFETVQLELQEHLSQVWARRETSRVADEVLRVIRDDADSFVNTRLASIQPILDQLYAAVDPHPTFRGVAFTTRHFYGKHRLDPVVIDESRGVEAPDPGRTLSTSQANAMAVALFLAFNLGLAPSHLGAVVLDDPLQNLDDIHLLGLVDLLRRVAPHRQMIITTHDASFARLLSRKLRPVTSRRRTRLITIVKWDSHGPALRLENLASDSQPMRLVAAE